MSRPLIALGAVIAALVLIAGDLQARPSGGSSVGSRGSRTNSAPPTTQTAPNRAAPIERSATQANAPARQTGMSQPGLGSGLFNRPGLIGGLFAGFLGAGLIGMLLGHGFVGGLSGLASIFGLLLQVALVAGVAALIWIWWQRRHGLATVGGPHLRDVGGTPGAAPGAQARSFGMGLGGAMSGIGNKVVIGKSDYDDFDRLLSEISLAYGAEDSNKLRSSVTPEMFSYFSEQLARNASEGVVNQVSGIKLLQGDLAESWREADVDYASVAMRYAITDTTIERATGRLVEGSNSSTEVTELWTFVRTRGGDWMLSAIQQA